MGKEKVILWGVGSIAEVIFYYLTTDSPYEISAFCVDRVYLDKEKFLGLPVIAFEDIDKIYPPDEYRMSIPIGYKVMNKVREEKYYAAKKKGYSFITYINSKVSYHGTFIGENCIILEGCVIQPYAKIGNNVIMWGGSYLAHHSQIRDHCFVAPNVTIAGNSIIGENSFLGANSTIRDNIIVGKSNLIGAGTVILNDTLDNEKFVEKGTVKKIKKIINT